MVGVGWGVMTDLFLIFQKAPFRDRSESGHTGGKLKKKNNNKGNKKIWEGGI